MNGINCMDHDPQMRLPEQSSIGVERYIPRNKITGEGGFMHYQMAHSRHAENGRPTMTAEIQETPPQQHDTTGSQEE